MDLPENANFEEIKKNYYKQSLKNHPDKGGSEETFKKINIIYEILKDENKKASYDKSRKEYLSIINSGFKKSENKPT